MRVFFHQIKERIAVIKRSGKNIKIIQEEFFTTLRYLIDSKEYVVASEFIDDFWNLIGVHITFSKFHGFQTEKFKNKLKTESRKKIPSLCKKLEAVIRQYNPTWTLFENKELNTESSAQDNQNRQYEVENIRESNEKISTYSSKSGMGLFLKVVGVMFLICSPFTLYMSIDANNKSKSLIIGWGISAVMLLVNFVLSIQGKKSCSE